MSLSPTVPDFKANLKSFWQKPEGKTGMLILAVCTLGLLYEGQALMQWAIGFLTDMLHLMILGGIVFAVIAVLSSKRFRCAISNLFQMSMRFLTGIVVEIDPIGILENTLDGMRDQARELGKAVEGTRGAKQGVEAAIQANTDAINHAKSLCDQAEKQILNAKNRKDDLGMQRYVLQRAAELQEIGRKFKSNQKLQQILGQTDKMYGMLIRWQNLAEFNIQNTGDEVKNAKQERQTILKAFKGMGFAQRIINGDPEQMKLMNQSLEYLATDNANKLGAMEDFARYSEKFLTQMDLESGASADDAEKMLHEYEQKLLSTGGTSVPLIMQNADPVPVSQSSSPDYLKFK